MTSYSSFTQDFPKRCMDILRSFEDLARDNDREVTLMLCIASAGFIIPFERLNPSYPNHIADDRHSKAVSKLGSLLGRSFTSWHEGTTWEYIDGIPGETIRATQIDQWANPDKRKILYNEKTAGSVFSHLRNALAHGNIFSYPTPTEQYPTTSIEILIFLSKCRDKETKQLLDIYNLLSVSPEGFRTFLEKWMEFLNGFKIPTDISQSEDFGKIWNK